MPEVRIEFGPAQQSGDEELAGAAAVAHNVVVDGAGAVYRRPRIELFGDIEQTQISGGLEVAGLYSALDGRVVAVGSQTPRRVWRMNDGAFELYSGDVPGLGRPQFAETESILVIAGGEKMKKLVLATDELSDLAGDPPQQVTHVIGNAARLLANSADINKTRVFYSDAQTGDGYDRHEDWIGGTSGSFQAESRPDPILAIGENTNEVFVWGPRTLQVYQPDEFYVYSPLPTLESGLAARYSAIKVDQSFAWLDQKRRFVLSDGRKTEVLSGPIQATLHAISTIGDCFGYRVFLGQTDILVWTFPTDGRTFAFQLGGGWAQWSGWDDAYHKWVRFPVSAHTYDLSGNNIVGTSDGFVGRLTFATTNDIGKTVRSFVTSGFMDCGTDRRKTCNVFLTIRRGKTSAAAEHRAGVLSWRDGLGTWESRPVELGELGDTSVTLRYRSLGVFRRRQWRFEFSGWAQDVLAKATMEYQELGS